ncbi:MAG: caspase family protein [Magnetococcus sp. DMHC-8]
MKSPVAGIMGWPLLSVTRWVLLVLGGGLLLAAPDPSEATTPGKHSNACVVAREMAAKGIALFERQHDQGLAAMQSAFTMCATDPNIAFNLGLAHYLDGHADQAEAVWDTLFITPSAMDAPNREKTVANLAWVKFELGKDKEALQMATDGLLQYPENWSLAHTKIFSLFRLGRYLEAYDWLSRAGFSGVRASQWQQQAAEYVVETLWRKFRECLKPQRGKPCEHDGQLPAIRQAINLLVKEYPNDTHFIEAKDRLLSAHLDKDADLPYPMELPHESWEKTGNVEDRSLLLDDQVKILPPVAVWEKREDAFAVIVGISHYQRVRARHFADRDALHLRQLLVERGVFKGDPDHVRLRINQEANRNTLADDLKWLVHQGRLNPGATLLFYFAGLGAPQPGEITLDDALLLPADAQPEAINAQTALSMAELKAALDKLSNPHVAVILDTCFNETRECMVHRGTETPNHKTSQPQTTTGELLHGLTPTPEFFHGRHAWLVAALQQKMVLHAPGRQGGLTYFLLKALLGEGDGTDGSPPDGWVDLAEAFAYAKKQMPDTDLFLSKPVRMRLTKTKGDR